MKTDVGTALKEMAKRSLGECWPIARMEFESIIGSWKSGIDEFTSLPGVDGFRLTLRLDLLPKDSTWNGPTRRSLVLILIDRYFVTDEFYPNRLTQAVFDFLDSPLQHDVVPVLGSSPAAAG
jgi:hypothetical protein